MLGGNIVVLTQLYWPTVHPALQEERKQMAKFAGRPGDLKWGKYEYPVTPTQKLSLEGLVYLLHGLPRALDSKDLWQGGFYSQNPRDGGVIIGLNHQSVTVDRNGRITSNEETQIRARRARGV